MNTRERKLLSKAIEVAKISTCNQRHGCVIAIGNRVMAVAVNMDRNNPWNVSYPREEGSYHAEVKALKQLNLVDLRKATLYSARVNRAGEPMMAKPCKYCQKIIDSFNIKKIIHT